MLTFEDMPAQTAESEAMSRDLKRRGFRFVGPIICYAFLKRSPGKGMMIAGYALMIAQVALPVLFDGFCRSGMCGWLRGTQPKLLAP